MRKRSGKELHERKTLLGQERILSNQNQIIHLLIRLCILNVTGGRGVVHTFGKQSLAMSWDWIMQNPMCLIHKVQAG